MSDCIEYGAPPKAKRLLLVIDGLLKRNRLTHATFTSQKPTEVFCKCNCQLVERHSIIGKAIEYGSIKVPKFIFKTFLKTLENGYTIYIFESE